MEIPLLGPDPNQIYHHPSESRGKCGRKTDNFETMELFAHRIHGNDDKLMEVPSLGLKHFVTNHVILCIKAVYRADDTIILII